MTIADRETEQTLRELIERRYPEHGILGEEFPAAQPDAQWRWMLDPIDGTATFIRGTPLWGVMVGLEHNDEPVLGVVHFPALGETIWARRGGGAWWQKRSEDSSGPTPARVSSVRDLREATLLYTDVCGFDVAGFQDSFERLRAELKFERTWGDCYGHLLVATGRAEIMLDPLLNEWDACALLPILEEACGRFTDWKGQRTIRGGNGISTNAALHDGVMNLLRGS